MEQNKEMDAGWNWVGRYVAVIVVSLILAALLGHMDLFENTKMGGKLNASQIVQFLGYGAALATLWVLGQRATIVLQRQAGKWSVLQHLILPAVSLLVAALAYSVLLLLLKPFMDASLSYIFNWVFIVAILACAGWLVMVVLLDQSASLGALFTERLNAGQGRVCGACGAKCEATAKFCEQCGKAL